MLQARTLVDCGTQDVSHQESDSKEKGGESYIVICKVERYPDKFNSYVFQEKIES